MEQQYSNEKLPKLEEDITESERRIRILQNKLLDFKKDREKNPRLTQREKEILVRVSQIGSDSVKYTNDSQPEDVTAQYNRVILLLKDLRNEKYKDDSDWFTTDPRKEKIEKLPPLYATLDGFIKTLEADLAATLVPRTEIEGIVERQLAVHEGKLKSSFKKVFEAFGVLLLQGSGPVSADQLNMRAEEAGVLKILGTDQVFTGHSPRNSAEAHDNNASGPIIEDTDPSDEEKEVTGTYVTGEKGKAIVALVKYQNKTKSAVEKLMCEFLRTKLMLHKNAKYISAIIDEAKAYFTHTAKITLENYPNFLRTLEPFTAQSNADKANAKLTDQHYTGFIYLISGKNKFVTQNEDGLAKTLFENAKNGEANAEEAYNEKMVEKFAQALKTQQTAPIGVNSFVRKLSTGNGLNGHLGMPNTLIGSVLRTSNEDTLGKK